MHKAKDFSKYLVIGPENVDGSAKGVSDVVLQSLKAGFTCIQIRSKQASARQLLECIRLCANQISTLENKDEITLLVNDRLDVALAAIDAGIKLDGIHVGQSDVPVSVCRKYLGKDAIIGISASYDHLSTWFKTSAEEVALVDYVGVGPLHESASKLDIPLATDGKQQLKTLQEIGQLCDISPIPVIVGGGLTCVDMPLLADVGADGFFVISAIVMIY